MRIILSIILLLICTISCNEQQTIYKSIPKTLKFIDAYVHKSQSTQMIFESNEDEDGGEYKEWILYSKEEFSFIGNIEESSYINFDHESYYRNFIEILNERLNNEFDMSKPKSRWSATINLNKYQWAFSAIVVNSGSFLQITRMYDRNAK